MPTFTLDELAKPVTRQEVQASIYTALGTLGITTTSWKPGAVPRAIIVAVSVVLSAFSQLMALIAKSGFLELSEGPWLELVALYVYDVPKEQATFATGFVTLTNDLGGDYVDEDLIFRNPTTGKTYRSAVPVSIPSGPDVTVEDVPIIATEAGSASTSGPDTITELTTTLLGVSCTNPASVVGRDAESDPSLRARCSAKLGSLSPFGPWDAYASAVRNATRPDGTVLGITRIRTVKDGYGNVTTYVATASGGVPGDAEDPDTDLGIANEAIQRTAAPLAVTADAASAEALPIVVAYELWMYNNSGRTQAEIEAAISARVVAFMASQPIAGNKTNGGLGKVFVNAIRATIMAAFPSHIFQCVVSSPASDVEVEAIEVPTLSAPPTATAIHQVPPPEGFSP